MLKVKKLHPKAKLPTRGSEFAAGYDLYWDGFYSNGVSKEGYAEVIPIKDDPWRFHTGISVEIPPGCVGLIKERSGLGSFGVQIRGGVIDQDYRGEIMVIMHGEHYWLSVGDKIAQLVIMPCFMEPAEEVANLSETNRGAGGFGSTGR